VTSGQRAPLLVRLAGYDTALVARLDARARRFFSVIGALSLIASIVVGLGMADGALLAFSSFAALPLGLVFAALTLNLYRLLHAGTGYPMHLPIEDIDDWRPGGAPALVLLALGFLVTQPLVFLALKPWLLAALADGDGLIRRAHAAWAHPLAAAPLTAALSLLVSAPAWLRILLPSAIRSYEKERWIEGRILVDDAFADAQDAITRALEPVPGFAPPLAIHHLDPPYNTKELVYGLDPEAVERGNVKWVKYKEPPPVPLPAPVAATPAAERAPPPAAEPAAKQAAKPTGPPPSPRPAPAPAAPAAPADATPTPPGAEEELVLSWDDPSHDADAAPPAIAFLDVGRLQVQRARAHMDEVAPFIAAFTGRSEEEVRGFLRAAPPEERVHRLFSDYKKLRSILLKDAAFALDHGLAPVVALIVQRPQADVEKRLRAAPRDKRLTGVFAPELARRLLKKNVPAAPAA
jgi:hypothetical protein